MITKYITIRVDFDTDDEELANDLALHLCLEAEDDLVDGIDVCGINPE